LRDTFRGVLERLISLARSPALQRVAEVALVVAIFAGSVADMFTAREQSGWGGPRSLELLAAVLISVPLLWRKRAPIAVLALVFVGGMIDVASVAPRQAGFEPFVAELVAYYSLGAHETERRSVVAFVVSLVFGAIPAAFLHETAGSVAPSLVFTFAAWLVGVIIRSWRSRAIALEQANRQLELQRELQAEAAVAVERGRIARELHDVIAHNVSMIVVQAGAAARVLEGAQPHVRDALEAIESTGRGTVDEMRRLLGVLRDSATGATLAPQPGLADLEKLVANVRDAGLPVEVHVEGTPTPLPPALDLTAFRIAQEALTNALKHAGPARAQVSIRYEPTAVEIEVRDDGSGNGNGRGSGHGLVGMRERAALWGGQVEAGRTTEGWRVRVRLPVEAYA
jgi:signal transduction histidine kinase